MKIIGAYILYKFGDFVSFFLRFDCLAWLYKPYSKIMLYSAKLDTEGKVWEYIDDSDLVGERGKEGEAGKTS